jgi:radical SAM protein with 4Fe4S-binding SPASM domain
VSAYINYIKKPVKNLSPRLGNIDIELTERCNNNCIHCNVNLPAKDHNSKAREMTTAQIKEILVEAVALGCLNVRFTGGEPLMRSDFEEIYIFARKLGLKVLLFTNARSITPHLADLFAHFPPLANIEITVYGMHSVSYETVSRVPGSFAQFRRGVSLLFERNVPFIFKMALLPANRKEINKFEAWAGTIPWMVKTPNYIILLDKRRSRDDWEKDRMITSFRLTPEEVLAIMTRNGEIEYRKRAQDFSYKFMALPGDQLFNCGAGRILSIDPYGYAHPCMGLRVEHLRTNIFDSKREESLSTALEHFESLGELRARNPVYLSHCAQCFLRGFCGQCPARSWTENGTFDTPVEYYCSIAHMQARYLGWLKENEMAWTVCDWRERIGHTIEKIIDD